MHITYIVSDIDRALAFEWIAQYLNRGRFRLSFILLNPGKSKLGDYLQQQSIEVYEISYTGKRDLPKAIWKVWRLLRQLEPHVVHAHLLYGSLIGLTAAKLASIKKRMYTRHHSDYHWRYFPKGIKWDKWCNKMATHIIAPSGAVKEILVKLEHVPENKVYVIHHGFDLSYFNRVSVERVTHLKEKYNTCGFYPVVGVISRFTELKGIQFTIPAFKRLLQQYPKALLLLFNAKGDYAKSLQQQMLTIPVENYRLIPFESDLAAVYQLFDVFVQASIDRTIEAFGQTYVEALASKVPSVFTLSGIAPDLVVDGENALVVPYKSSEKIYTAILEILQNNGLKNKLIENGYKSVQEKFALKVMIQKLEELYAAK